ncbi:hypothetical protein HKX48_000530 [Thoreauomyces humboldtii]|nr:hypothetical protein HKX48_000530 [Thoreauomyces humboldtii]
MDAMDWKKQDSLKDITDYQTVEEGAKIQFELFCVGAPINSQRRVLVRMRRRKLHTEEIENVAFKKGQEVLNLGPYVVEDVNLYGRIQLSLEVVVSSLSGGTWKNTECNIDIILKSELPLDVATQKVLLEATGVVPTIRSPPVRIQSRKTLQRSVDRKRKRSSSTDPAPECPLSEERPGARLSKLWEDLHRGEEENVIIKTFKEIYEDLPLVEKENLLGLPLDENGSTLLHKMASHPQLGTSRKTVIRLLRVFAEEHKRDFCYALGVMNNGRSTTRFLPSHKDPKITRYSQRPMHNAVYAGLEYFWKTVTSVLPQTDLRKLLMTATGTNSNVLHIAAKVHNEKFLDYILADPAPIDEADLLELLTAQAFLQGQRLTASDMAKHAQVAQRLDNRRLELEAKAAESAKSQ